MDGPQAYYQTAFPRHDTSGELRQAFGAIRRILSEVTYDTYAFRLDTAPTEEELRGPGFRIAAQDTLFTHQDRAATALTLARSGRRVTLMTVNHAVQFPDTIVDLFEPAAGETGAEAASGTRRVERVSIKRSEVFRLVGETDLLPFRVLARDPLNDLALLGLELRPGLPPDASPLMRAPAGDSRRLTWGSFVYVLGYPQGYPMVTRGIVSAPGEPTPGSFRVDGLWNRGMSGGAILAVRGDGRGLEWVGMARAAAANPEVMVRPQVDAVEREELGRRYDGPLFLDQVNRIQYGITFAVPMTEIRRFLDRERDRLAAEGFPAPRL